MESKMLKYLIKKRVEKMNDAQLETLYVFLLLAGMGEK